MVKLVEQVVKNTNTTQARGGPNIWGPLQVPTTPRSERDLVNSFWFSNPSEVLSLPGLFFPDLGPGAYYDPESTTLGGPAFTLAGRPEHGAIDADGSDMPGPGAYTRDGDEKSGRAFTFGRRVRRHDENKSEAPPPGAYEVAESKKGPAFSMGGRPAEKAKSADADAEPGPGEYYQPDPASRGPAFSMPGRAPSKKPVDLGPGPGAYYGEDEPTGPAYSIAGRPEEKPMAKDGLGPGAYHDPDHTSLGGPAYTIPGRPHEKPEAVQTPGPADYHHVEPSGPAFTMGGGGSGTPAPGDYASTSSTSGKGAGPSYSMPRASASSEPYPRTGDAPGPGKYKPKAVSKGPSYTMGGGGAGFEGAKPETPLVGGTAAPPAPVGPSFTLGRRLPDE